MPSDQQKRQPTTIREALERALAAHEVALIELREARDDVESTIAALNLLQRIRKESRQ